MNHADGRVSPRARLVKTPCLLVSYTTLASLVSEFEVAIRHKPSNLHAKVATMKLALALCLVTASTAFQHLRPASRATLTLHGKTRVRDTVALRGKTRGDGTEQPEDDGPLDIDAAIDEALKSPSIVDAISEDINAALGKDDAKTPEDMKIGELTAELDLRGIDYSDCIEADELRAKLKDARLSGRAGKDVLDNFNKATAEAMFDKEKNPMNLSKEELEAIKGEDGAIPGGLEPDEVFKLMNDPEVMAMVQKPKFQEIMADVMKGGGPMTLQKHMADPESRDMLMTLTKLLQNAGMVPPGASR